MHSKIYSISINIITVKTNTLLKRTRCILRKFQELHQKFLLFTTQKFRITFATKKSLFLKKSFAKCRLKLLKASLCYSTLLHVDKIFCSVIFRSYCSSVSTIKGTTWKKLQRNILKSQKNKRIRKYKNCQFLFSFTLFTFSNIEEKCV